MGGAGSGNRWRTGARRKCEDLLDLRISDLSKGGLLSPGRRGNLEWTVGGRPFRSIDIFTREDSLELTYRRLGPAQEWQRVLEVIALDSADQYFGGERRWFICPCCDRRCAVLYAGEEFRCRLCLNLAYRSQSEDHRYRCLSRARKLRQRLGGAAANTPLQLLDKPTGMHWRTYNTLYEKGVALEQATLRAFSEIALKLNAVSR
ncbi:hypothetical protein [Mesorhizobium sangaii]|uniref:Uncharacterized protein n=1 Tax=Mesorhizobium sangaii TaxID=505389 RepID=A0A841PC97_9HYPH|nr:hypothetical protein [Mesorhizobium sangaii]MBB6411281.1 hypothetical protein [Mesorhizobium sangaii]